MPIVSRERERSGAIERSTNTEFPGFQPSKFRSEVVDHLHERCTAPASQPDELVIHRPHAVSA